MKRRHTLPSNLEEVLAEQVSQAKEAGASHELLEEAAYQLGNYLTENFDPNSSEQRLLKEMWESSDEDQRRNLAEIVLNVVDKA